MYTPLKITTDYSLLKSLIKIPDLINFLNVKNIKSCAICDDNLYGSLEFYTKCKKNNIKPIIGLEIEINNKKVYLYAKNYDGYKNLLKIHTVKEEREVGIVDLEKYKDNILIIIPFKSIELFKHLQFFEYIYIGFSNIYEKNNALLLTNNVLYVNDIKVLDEKKVKYFKYLDMLRKEKESDYTNNYYKEESIIDKEKIEEFVNLIDLQIPNNKRYIPVYNKNIDSFMFLKSLAIKGLKKRLNEDVPDAYKKRLNYELEIIKNMGFVDYFLVVYDYVLYAKKNNILVGPGRGSAAGSLVSYVIGITDIDPLKYNLLFERFLNPARVTMPDIDIDFDAMKRDMVIKYVKEKYGYENVALGLTFGTLKSRSVIREIAKLLKVNNELVDNFCKVIDPSKDLRENLKINVVKEYLNNYTILKKVYEIAFNFEGIKRNFSIHAAGVVISNIKLDEVIPIKIKDGEIITGVPLDYLENIGLLKMDFLSLKNLTTMSNILNMLPENPLKNIDLEKKEVYELFKSGKTEGIFQFETASMKNLIAKLKPNCFNDLVVAIALDRPGPKEFVNTFIRRKNKLEETKYIHKDLESILKETYGIIIYQEQIIAILVKIAGYTNQEADLIRRAISKKKEEDIIKEREKFIEKTVKRNYSYEIANQIYDLIVKFAGYGFNKSHSVSYAIISYQMAYLKTFYPEYFIIELLNDSPKSNQMNTYFSYLKSKNIKFYKPSINNSKLNYYIENKKLMMPLWLIKGISKEISQKILNNKKDGYTDIFDFTYKNKDFINEEIMKQLINAGAMSSFMLNKQTLINNIDSAINYSLIADDDGLIKKPIIVMYEEYNEEILRNLEYESYGFYIKNHPTSKYMNKEYIKLHKIKEYLFKNIKCVILIDKITKIKTKKGEDMAFIRGSDETDVCEFTVFPNRYKLLENINENTIIEVSGSVEKRFDKYVIIVNNIKRMGGLHE